MLRKRQRPEQTIQRAIFQHIRQRGVPGLIAWHTPQGNKLGGKKTAEGIPLQGIINKRLGVLAGVSDVLAFHDGKLFCLEIKAAGHATEAQLEFQSRMEANGAYCCVATGLDRALACLEAWGLLRGATA